MDKEAIVKVIDFWQKAAKEKGLFPRALIEKINIKSSEIIDVVGSRRGGKSSLLKLLIEKINGLYPFLYINFEDPFFIDNNQPAIIENLIEIYKEYFDPKLKYLFFDEIQNIENWEKAVRKLYDGEKYKFFITGSSSKLLSSELATLITGRHLSYELMPLTFKEYLSFKGLEISDAKGMILHRTKIAMAFDKFLKLGGFPKIVLDENVELLKQYYSDILEKDILKRYNIRQKLTIEKMGIYLLSNAAKTLSLAELEKTFKLSFEATSAYLGHFLDAFLAFELPQFSYSLKTQQKAYKKIYAIDTGLANAVSFRFSEDKGRRLENCVFLHLRQMSEELYYYKTKSGAEVDFLVKQSPKKMELIQVCVNIDSETTKKREINSLLEAMDEIGARTALILTESTKTKLKIKGKTINIIPAYEWLMK